MYVFTWVHRWFPAVAVQWNGVDRNHCLWCSPSHSCNCVFPRWFRSPTNSFPTHTPCLPSVRWLIVELKKDTQIGIQHSWLKWKNVCLVLMGKKMQSTGILFLEYSVHFSLNLVLDIVMNAPTMVCTSSGCSKGILAPPSCPAIFYSKEDVRGKTIIWNWSRLYGVPGNRKSPHSGFVISFSFTSGWELCAFSSFCLSLPRAWWYLNLLTVFWGLCNSMHYN